MSMSTAPGLSASTASALGSSTATHPGPLSAQARSVIGPADAQDLGDVPGDRLLHRPGADQRRRSERQPHRDLADLDQARPAFLHEHLGEGRLPPASSHAWQVPRVGWPANGSSRLGVKIRTW